MYTLFSLYVLLADVCDLPKRIGHCLAHMPRWCYNKNAGQCEKFIYGGCGGNMNNFETAAECRRMCPCPRLVCDKTCEFCHELDKNGCRTCDCSVNPCLVSVVTGLFNLCCRKYARLTHFLRFVSCIIVNTFWCTSLLSHRTSVHLVLAGVSVPHIRCFGCIYVKCLYLYKLIC